MRRIFGSGRRLCRKVGVGGRALKVRQHVRPCRASIVTYNADELGGEGEDLGAQAATLALPRRWPEDCEMVKRGRERVSTVVTQFTKARERERERGQERKRIARGEQTRWREQLCSASCCVVQGNVCVCKVCGLNDMNSNSLRGRAVKAVGV